MATMRRLWNIARRSRMDDELRQEIDTHIALIEDEARAHGSSPDQASYQARLRFGNASSYREQALDGVIAIRIENTWKEIGFAFRRLARTPTFTLASALTLALGIGANGAMFAVVERVVLNPLPYPQSDRLIELDHGSERLHVPAGFGLTQGLYYQYLERAQTLQSVAIYQADEATLTGNGDPERIRIARATPSLAPVMQVGPALGRWFTEQEGSPGGSAVGVLSHGLWIRRYGGDSEIVGRLIVLDGIPTQVIGIMPASFAFPDSRVEVWLPTQIARAMGFGLWSYNGVARLRDGVALTDARREMAQLIEDLPNAFPGDPYAFGNVETKLIVTARTLKEAKVGAVTRALWTLLASVALVLLVACANISNLFLVRTEVRQREIAIRRALGAGRLGIVRYFVAESALLSTVGGALGLVVAAAAVGLLVRFGPATLPRLNEVRLDHVALAYTFVLSLLTAIAFGTLPLWRSASVGPALYEHGRGQTASRRRHRARHVLIGAQVASALVLLIASALMVQSFHKLRALDPGFESSSALTFAIGLPNREYTTAGQAVAAHQAILDRLIALPNVKAASASTCLPLAGGCFGNTLLVRGRVLRRGTVPPVALFRAVAGGYFEAMGMQVLRGRGIDRRDVDRREPIVVVDQTLADRFFPNENPIGQHVASNRAPARPGAAPDLVWLEIVGVVKNVPVLVLADPNPLPQLYMPMSIAAGPDIPVTALVGPDVGAMSYVVRSSAAPVGLLPAIRRAVDTVDSKLALAQVRTLREMLDRASAQMAFTMVLLVVAAGAALLLGIIGTYGVTSYIVTKRTTEIGVRLALGAEPHTVARMIVRQGAIAALGGIAVGLPTAFAGSRVIESLLYGVSARDTTVFAATAVVLLAIAVAASWVPARRAAQLTPLDALRVD